MFCEKCGALLLPKQDRKGRQVLSCAVCGFSKTPGRGDNYTLRKVIVHTEHDETVVVDEPEAIDQLPVAKETCPKCGFSRASYWQRLVQTQEADPTLFYRCRGCGHTWRDTS